MLRCDDLQERGGLIQRHNELRDLEAELLSTSCEDVQVETVPQQLTRESLNRGPNRAPDALLDIHTRVSGKDKDVHSSNLWYVTQMQILTAEPLTNLQATRE